MNDSEKKEIASSGILQIITLLSRVCHTTGTIAGTNSMECNLRIQQEMLTEISGE